MSEGLLLAAMVVGVLVAVFWVFLRAARMTDEEARQLAREEWEALERRHGRWEES